jgi:hypothetical protein
MSSTAADVLFLVEGAGQGNLGKNWGDGTAADPTVISSRGLSDPNPFFSALLQKPYLSQVIIGPHVYPPSISMAQDETQVGHACLSPWTEWFFPFTPVDRDPSEWRMHAPVLYRLQVASFSGHLSTIGMQE